MDSNQVEKIYVILGNDLQDGFKTLDWTIKKWKSNQISIVILHVSCNNISNDFVYTPFGKLPASSVSEEKLQVLRKYEQEKIQTLLSKYIAFCGKVKTEILKVEKCDEQIHKVIVELISKYKISKLVLGLTFLRSSSWRSKNAISGSFYIHQHKPNFCEFFIICGGKLVFLRGENEELVMEDNQGLIVAKKGSIKSWLGKMFSDNNYSIGRNSYRLSASSKNLDSFNSRNLWENCVEEIQSYYEHLSSLNLDEETRDEENGVLQTGPQGENLQKSETMTLAEKSEYTRSKIDDTRKNIQLKKEEAKTNAERSIKAEWAINLCNTRAEELEARIKEEIANRTEIKKALDAEKEQIQEIMSGIAENKNRLKLLLELQSELSNKLKLSTLARSHGEAELEKAVVARVEMIRDIEALRRQRDVLQRRVEFCKEKDAIGMITKQNELTCGYREYSAEDIRLATDGFSERLRFKSSGDWTNVYRGRIHNMSVAIKMLNSDNVLSRDDFLGKMKLLHDIRHPHLVAVMGFCSEKRSIVFECMHNGSLKEILFSTSRNNRKRSRDLSWNDRIRIAHEVCSGLSYLHAAKPRPIIHGHLTTSNILLDCHIAAKVSGFGLCQCHDRDDNTRLDIRAFGILLLHLMTGRNWAGLVEETMDRTALARVLDENAGQWPLDLCGELVRVAMKCTAIDFDPRTDFSIAKIMEELNIIRKKADEIVAKGGLHIIKAADDEKSSEVPGIFLCPIFQDVMKNPHVAADGFSYEFEAIDEWLKMGRDTSPMTNLKLQNTFLTPNHTLRSLIEDWYSKKSKLAS